MRLASSGNGAYNRPVRRPASTWPSGTRAVNRPEPSQRRSWYPPAREQRRGVRPSAFPRCRRRGGAASRSSGRFSRMTSRSIWGADTKEWQQLIDEFAMLARQEHAATCPGRCLESLDHRCHLDGFRGVPITQTIVLRGAAAASCGPPSRADEIDGADAANQAGTEKRRQTNEPTGPVDVRAPVHGLESASSRDVHLVASR